MKLATLLTLSVLSFSAISAEQSPKPTEQDYQLSTLRLQRDTSANDIVVINAKLQLALDRIKELEATKNSCPAPAK
jgi:hypothetical protein